MNPEDLLTRRCALLGRGIQQELPSSLTNGQEAGEMFQRKMFHVLQNSLVFFGCAYGQPCSAGKMGSPDEYVFNPM
jgi:hypothetical protein